MIDEQDHLRDHIRIFVNQQVVKELSTPLASTDEVYIIAAISGGSG
jgi:sulfur-carrier protein